MSPKEKCVNIPQQMKTAKSFFWHLTQQRFKQCQFLMLILNHLTKSDRIERIT